MKAVLHNMKGEQVGEITLPKEIFGIDVNENLISRVVYSQRINMRQGTAHTKDRSEVSGGGRKPWRQKGTGRARHGSIRSPIWVGGGVAFGPRKERSYKKKINKKEKRKALFMILSAKLKKETLFFVDKLEIQNAKTKKMGKFLESISCGDAKTLVVLPKMDEKIILATRNLEKADTVQAKDINPLLLLCYKHIIFPANSVKVIKENFKP